MGNNAMSTTDIDRLFTGLTNGIDQGINTMNKMADFANNFCADSRRNTQNVFSNQNSYNYGYDYGNTNNQQPVQYGYGYGNNASGNGPWGSVMNSSPEAVGYPGFWNPSYGMGGY